MRIVYSATNVQRVRAFTLIELLVALAIFAVLAALTYGALSQIARTRSILATQEDRFAAVVRAMSALERDLRQAIARPVRGNYGEALPALIGAGDRIELTRVGFANPRAELRSHLERVAYRLDTDKLRRAHYPVLDRAPGTLPDTPALLNQVREFHLRYLNSENIWSDVWPPRESVTEVLPRAVEFRLVLSDYDELRRIVILPSVLPLQVPASHGSSVASTKGGRKI